MAELRLAVRTLSRTPAFTAVVVLSLALGIGANSAIFGLADQVLLRLLPVESPRELVQLRLEGGRFGSNSGDGVHTFSHPLYLALRERNTVLSGLTGQLVQPASLLGEDRNERVSVGLVAGNTGIPTNLWVPVMMKPTITPTWDELDNERYSWFYLFGRLKPGVTRDAAEASMRVLYRQRQDEELKNPFFTRFPDQKERFLKQTLTLIPASRGMSSLGRASSGPSSCSRGWSASCS
jgi:hypothetical protein